MKSLREEFYNEYQKLQAPDWRKEKINIADWWITTLKERIEVERLPIEHKVGNIVVAPHGEKYPCDACLARKEFNEGLDTITRLLE